MKLSDGWLDTAKTPTESIEFLGTHVTDFCNMSSDDLALIWH